MEDGNSRNGYHKVKCQVPETEELQGREKGGENKSTINPKKVNVFAFYLKLKTFQASKTKSK